MHYNTNDDDITDNHINTYNTNVFMYPNQDMTEIKNWKEKLISIADDFAGMDTIPSRGAAKCRPVGLTIGPDGTLYISDSQKGRIWRVVYTGEKTTASNTAETKSAANATKTLLGDTGAAGSLTGASLFRQLACNTCHTTDPKEPESTGPSLYRLFGSRVILQDGSTEKADTAYIRESILQAGAKKVAGYMPVMPSYDGQLTDGQINRLVSYVRSL